MEEAVGRALLDILGRRAGGPGAPRLLGVYRGHVNTVLKAAHAGREYAVRIRTHEGFLSHEKDLFKEVFAACLLRDPAGPVRKRFKALAKTRSGSHPGCPEIGGILHYDARRRAVPYRFSILDWAEGESLWSADARTAPGLYRLAGEALAKLHRRSFDAHYPDLHAFCGGRGESWSGLFRRSFDAVLGRAELSLPKSLAAGVRAYLGRLDLSGADRRPARLVHRDFSGANLIFGPGRKLRIIDWDNWGFGAPEADLVKMKHWTAVRVRAGKPSLLQDEGLSRAFLAGYGDGLSAGVFHAEELRWLLLVYSVFRDAGPALSPYPGHGEYLERLRRLLAARGKNSFIA